MCCSSPSSDDRLLLSGTPAEIQRRGGCDSLHLGLLSSLLTWPRPARSSSSGVPCSPALVP